MLEQYVMIKSLILAMGMCVMTDSVTNINIIKGTEAEQEEARGKVSQKGEGGIHNPWTCKYAKKK